MSHISKFSHLNCTVQWLLLYLQGCATVASNSRTFSSTQKEMPSPQKKKPLPHDQWLPPPPQPLTTRNLCLRIGLFWTFPISGVTPCVCPSVPASLTEHHVLRVHPRGSECQGFTPFSGQVCEWMYVFSSLGLYSFFNLI